MILLPAIQVHEEPTPETVRYRDIIDDVLRIEGVVVKLRKLRARFTPEFIHDLSTVIEPADPIARSIMAIAR